jgi:hypothetical protein
MSAHGGPNIVEDGLVLALDAANIKSFRGIPTVNYLSNPTQTFNAGEFYQYYDLRPIFETYGLVPYSLSFEARGNIPGYCLVYMQNGSYTKYAFVSTVINLTTDWKLYTFENITPSGPTSAWQQNTPGDNRAMLATYTIYGTGRNPQIRNMQLELGTVATPFVDGTRGTTVATGGGWADRSGNGNNGELVNGPTYNSSNGGSIVFDGVNDTITTNISLTSLAALSNFSIECWVKIPSYPTAATPNIYNKTTKSGVLVGAAYYSGTAIYWKGNATGTAFTVFGYIRGNDAYRSTSAYSVTNLNGYNCFTLVNNYSNSTFSLYVNGLLHNTVTGPTQEYNSGLAATAGNIGINKAQVDGGGEDNYTFLQCSIPLSKIYNRALSAAEVLQNYNATKGRFGL